MLRARLIAGVPADLVGSLTGLTEGRFPVYARARYADDLAERDATKRVKRGQNAANVIESNEDRRGIEIFASKGAPVGRHQRRRDQEDRHVDGASAATSCSRTCTATATPTAHLGSVARYYPVPKEDAQAPRVGQAGQGQRRDPQARRAGVRRPPGRDPDDSDGPRPPGHQREQPRRRPRSRSRSACSPTRTCPARARTAASSSCSTAKARKGGGFTSFRNYFSRPFGLDSRDVRLRRLKVGSRVIGGTILGRVGKTDARQGAAPLLRDPAGRQGRAADRPEADPRRLEAARGHRDLPRLRQATPSTATTAAASRSARSCCCPSRCSRSACSPTSAIEIYAGGRAGHPLRPDRPPRARHARVPGRVRAASPTVTSLKSGHGFYTTSGNVSAALVRQRGRHRQDQRHPDPRPPGTRRHHRADRADADAAAGHDAPAPDHLAARLRREHARDGRPRRPHPRRLPAAVRRQQEARQAGARRAQARPVVRPDRPAAPDRQPGRPDQAVQVRDSGQEDGRRAAAARTGASSATADFFGFVQLEFGFLLGPPDGRYLVRDGRANSANAILVLRTLGAPQRRRLPGARRGAWSRRPTPSRCPPRAPR